MAIFNDFLEASGGAPLPSAVPAALTEQSRARRERVTAHAGSRARLCMLDFWSGRTHAEAVAAVKCISRNGKASRV